MKKKKTVRRVRVESIPNTYRKNPSRVNVSLYSKKLPKDVLTTDVIDYDFLRVRLNPPRKQKKTYYYQTLYFRSFDNLFFDFGLPKKKKYSGSGGGGGGGFFTRGGDFKQRCVVKVFHGYDHYAHKKFLKNYMRQENKQNVVEKPELFNADADIVPDADLAEYEKRMVGLHYKFIISPENQNVPIENLVRSFVSQLEAATGYSFYWVAVKHSDTGHIHSHVLINGLDRNGKEVKLDRQLKYETARKIACNLCTHYAGKRTEKEIELGRSKAIKALFFTKYDNDIAKYEENYSEIKAIGNEQYEGEVILRNETMKKRMDVLVKLGFAKLKDTKKNPPVYMLVANWIQALKSARYYNSFLKARSSLSYTPASNLEQYRKEMGRVEGIITQRFVMNDEDNYNNALVIEDRNTGKAYYVPIGFKPDQDMIGSPVTCYVPDGLMHPKITIKKQRPNLTQENKI